MDEYISPSRKSCVFVIEFLPPSERCYKLDMDAETGGWKSASPLMRWHGWGFDMAALGNKAYVLGGYQDYYDRDDWVLETMERYDEDTNTWSDVAWYPHYIFNHCMAPDEETGRIYVLGGQRRNGPYNEDWGELRYYEVRSLTILKRFLLLSGVFKLVARHLEYEVAPTPPCVRDCQDGGRR